MPPATLEAPAKLTKANYGRTFEVIRGQTGPFKQGHVFSEFEFRRLHPAPPHVEGEDDVDPEAYWEGVLNRLLNSSKQMIRQPCDEGTPGAVKEDGGIFATETPVHGPTIKEVFGVKPMPTEPGPLANPLKPIRNPLEATLKQAVKEGVAEAAKLSK